MWSAGSMVEWMVEQTVVEMENVRVALWDSRTVDKRVVRWDGKWVEWKAVKLGN